MVRKKKAQEYEDKINQALAVLGMVSEDSTTPRNIRRAAKDAMGALQSSEYTPAVRASNAVSLLDEILQDPNMPFLYLHASLLRSFLSNIPCFLVRASAVHAAEREFFSINHFAVASFIDFAAAVGANVEAGLNGD
jgi:uncharacterized protein (UPF0147 family)